MKLNKATVFFILSILLIADLFIQKIPLEFFFVIILGIQINYLKKFENAFIFLLFFSIISGAFFISRGISGLGGLFIPIGILLISKDIVKHRIKLFINYLPLLAIFIFFSISALIFNGGDYYTTKIVQTVVFGTIYYLAFSIFFQRFNETNIKSLSFIFLIWGLFLLRLVIDINNLPGPQNILDFEFMRQQTYSYGANAIVSLDDFTISYHLPGFIALIGLSVFLSNNKNTRSSKILIWSISLLIILYSGARQNLVGYISLLMFYLYNNLKVSVFKRLVIISILGIISLYMLSYLNSDLVQSTIKAESLQELSESTGRYVLQKRGIDLFLENPFFGVGFGHYNFSGSYESFPHNFIIELFAEIGIIGFVFVFILSFISYSKSKLKLKKYRLHNIYPLLIIVPIFIRAMISGNLTTNILFFSLIFALPFLPSTQNID